MDGWLTSVPFVSAFCPARGGSASAGVTTPGGLGGRPFRMSVAAEPRSAQKCTPKFYILF